MAQQSIESKGKKFALLSDELYKNLRNENLKTEHTQSPQFSLVKKLDESIGEILSNTHLPDGIKARMYSEAVADFLAARSKAPEVVYGQPLLPPMEPAPLTTTTTVQKQDKTKQDDDEDDFARIVKPVATGGPRYKKAAKKKEILDSIRPHRNIISHDPDTGQLIVNGHKHADTNIFDILDYVSSYKLPADDPPPGTGRFMEALGRAGLPKSIVRHNKLRNLMGTGKKPRVAPKNREMKKQLIFKWDKLY